MHCGILWYVASQATKALISKLSEFNVNVWGNTDKSVFLSKLNITPYLSLLQTIY